MYDKHSDYALNKMDESAIIYPSVTSENVRLTREQFDTEEEFAYWKVWSDGNYHKIELDGHSNDDCLSFEAQRDTPVQSAEDVILASLHG